MNEKWNNGMTLVHCSCVEFIIRLQASSSLACFRFVSLEIAIFQLSYFPSNIVCYKMEQHHIETNSFVSHHHSAVPHNLHHPNEHEQFLVPPKPGQVCEKCLWFLKILLIIWILSFGMHHQNRNSICTNYFHHVTIFQTCNSHLTFEDRI